MNKTSTPQATTMRVYVACLASYNSGRLHGAWVDVTDPDTMQDEIDAMLAASTVRGAEEYAIHDYKNMLDLGDHVNLDELCAWGELCEEHDFDVVCALHAYGYREVDEARDRLENAFRGEYASVEAYADELIDETWDVPKHILPYVDVAKFARDLELGGDIVALELPCGNVAIFDAG